MGVELLCCSVSGWTGSLARSLAFRCQAVGHKQFPYLFKADGMVLGRRGRGETRRTGSQGGSYACSVGYLTRRTPRIYLTQTWKLPKLSSRLFCGRVCSVEREDEGLGLGRTYIGWKRREGKGEGKKTGEC